MPGFQDPFNTDAPIVGNAVLPEEQLPSNSNKRSHGYSFQASQNLSPHINPPHLPDSVTPVTVVNATVNVETHPHTFKPNPPGIWHRVPFLGRIISSFKECFKRNSFHSENSDDPPKEIIIYAEEHPKTTPHLLPLVSLTESPVKAPLPLARPLSPTVDAAPKSFARMPSLVDAAPVPLDRVPSVDAAPPKAVNTDLNDTVDAAPEPTQQPTDPHYSNGHRFSSKPQFKNIPSYLPLQAIPGQEMGRPGLTPIADHRFSREFPRNQRPLQVSWADESNAALESWHNEPEFALGHKPARVFIYDHPFEEDDDVSEQFIQMHNAHIGNQRYKERAERMLKKMRILGGLEPSSVPSDIPAARLGLCMLATLNNHRLKMDALDSLYEIIHNDELSEYTSIQLVSLVIKLMKNMDRELFQTEIIETQIKIARVYDAASMAIQSHYVRKHINAVTMELKAELTAAAKALAALNTQRDYKLAFYVNCALEAVRRLKDDKNELFDLLVRLTRVVVGIAGILARYPQTFIDQISQAFADVDFNGKEAWYDAIYIMRHLQRAAMFDPKQLIALQIFVRDRYRKLNWKFAYAASLAFLEICEKGSTEEIRKNAFEGTPGLGYSECPSLKMLSSVRSIPTYRDYDALIHLGKPKSKDPNIALRDAGIHSMLHLADQAKDDNILKLARKFLLERKEAETDPTLKELLARNLPPDIPNQPHAWLRNDVPSADG